MYHGICTNSILKLVVIARWPPEIMFAPQLVFLILPCSKAYLIHLLVSLIGSMAELLTQYQRHYPFTDIRAVDLKSVWLCGRVDKTEWQVCLQISSEEAAVVVTELPHFCTFDATLCSISFSPQRSCSLFIRLYTVKVHDRWGENRKGSCRNGMIICHQKTELKRSMVGI